MASERVQRRVDRLLDQIEEAIEQRDWSHVRELAQDVIALDRDNDDAQAFLDASEQRLSSSEPAHLEPIRKLLTPEKLSRRKRNAA